MITCHSLSNVLYESLALGSDNSNLLRNVQYRVQGWQCSHCHSHKCCFASGKQCERRDEQFYRLEKHRYTPVKEPYETPSCGLPLFPPSVPAPQSVFPVLLGPPVVKPAMCLSLVGEELSNGACTSSTPVENPCMSLNMWVAPCPWRSGSSHSLNCFAPPSSFLSFSSAPSNPSGCVAFAASSCQ